MQTQINCPNCGTRFAAQVYNVVDARRTPELKQMLLSGSLNVATCPNCGSGTQLAVPMAYHDADHQLFMTYVPMELNLPLPEQEKLIGQMTKAVTEGIPQEQFKAYLLQPQTVLTMQSFMEKVYGTEGITPQMLARQREQSQLLQQLLTSNHANYKELLAQKEELIDENFMAMIGANLQNVEQSQAPQANEIFIRLTNLQAWLFTHTDIGRELERQQMAIRAFQQAVQKNEGLSYELFVDHLLANIDDEPVVDTIIQMGYQGIRYELFTHLTEKIEAETDPVQKSKMEQLRTRLLEMYEAMQTQAKEQIARAQTVLDQLISADNLDETIRQKATDIDDSFIYFLTAQINQAEQQNEEARLTELKRVHEAILAEAEKQMPPELKLINRLMLTNDPAERQEIVNGISAEEKPQMAALLQIMGAELVRTDPSLQERLVELQHLLTN